MRIAVSKFIPVMRINPVMREFDEPATEEQRSRFLSPMGGSVDGETGMELKKGGGR